MSLASVILEAIGTNITTRQQLHELKIQYAEHFGVNPPPNSELVRAYRALLQTGKISENRSFARLLRKRAVRTLSGVAPVAVLTKPLGCPGRCVFCPTEENVPKSYLSNEPAVMRAILNDYDSFRQVESRLKTLHANGHPTDKIELIVMGGTWSAHPKRYQTTYIRDCLNAMNGVKSHSLTQAQKLNETAPHRCVATVLETRQDWITVPEIKRMRRLGATRIEIGAQTVYDDVLDLVKRGHRVDATIRATQLLKDAGFKISYHMMPNLPGSTVERDIDMFREIFANPNFKPDMIKFYPCVVVPCAELKLWLDDGRYLPYTDDELLEVILGAKKYFPRYLRVTRLIRDIPATSIIGGSKVSNLRQVAHEMMKKRGIVCQCIRCREIRADLVDHANVELNVMEYEASGGSEFFLSLDEMKLDKICALARLRFSSQSLSGRRHFIRELEGAALLRELHTYGAQLALGDREKAASQHVGFGKRLVAEAETIAKRHGYKKMAVIAGVGIREYYRKLGYDLEGTYMLKSL